MLPAISPQRLTLALTLQLVILQRLARLCAIDRALAERAGMSA